MVWKILIPVLLVILVAGFVLFKGLPKNIATIETSPIQAEKVTSQNVDQTLNRTDTQIQQNLDQMDADFKEINATSTKEEDPNSL